MANLKVVTADVPRESIQDIGNIDTLVDQYGQTYMFRERTSIPIGVLYYSKTALKVYHMKRKLEPMPEHICESLDNFLKSEIDSGGLETAQGIGFAILSQGFLSINMWGRGNVLFTQTYTIEQDSQKLNREPLEKTGVACTWEAQIMNFEYALWHEYLKSDMSDQDKVKYLESYIAGDL